jgi:hypothetical protein
MIVALPSVAGRYTGISIVTPYSLTGPPPVPAPPSKAVPGRMRGEDAERDWPHETHLSTPLGFSCEQAGQRISGRRTNPAGLIGASPERRIASLAAGL